MWMLPGNPIQKSPTKKIGKNLKGQRGGASWWDPGSGLGSLLGSLLPAGRSLLSWLEFESRAECALLAQSSLRKLLSVPFVPKEAHDVGVGM